MVHRVIIWRIDSKKQNILSIDLSARTPSKSIYFVRRSELPLVFTFPKRTMFAKALSIIIMK